MEYNDSIRCRIVMGRIFLSVMVCFLFADTTRAWDEVTHAYITEKVIEEITIPELRQLLERNRSEFLSGCWFTDSYQYTEDRIKSLNPHHLETYADIYLGYLEQPAVQQQENYEQLIALFFGSIAHTTEDFWLDNILYHYPKTIGEDLSGDVYNGVVTINKFNYLTRQVIPYFPAEDLYAMYTQADMLEPVYDTREKFENVFERLISKQYEQLRLLKLLSFLASKQVQNELPWMSANIKDAPGGMLSCSRNTARYMEALWSALNHTSEYGVLNVEFSALDNRLGLLLCLSQPVADPEQLDLIVQNTDHDTLKGSIEAYSFGGTRTRLVNLVYRFEGNREMEAGTYSVTVSLSHSDQTTPGSTFEVSGYPPAKDPSYEPHSFLSTMGAGLFLFMLCLGIAGLFWGLSGIYPFIRGVKQSTGKLPVWSRIVQRGLQGIGAAILGFGLYLLLTRGWLVVLNV